MTNIIKMDWVEIRVKTILGYIKVKIVVDDDTFKHDMDEMMEYSDLIYKASDKKGGVANVTR